MCITNTVIVAVSRVTNLVSHVEIESLVDANGDVTAGVSVSDVESSRSTVKEHDVIVYTIIVDVTLVAQSLDSQLNGCLGLAQAEEARMRH